MRLEAPPAVVVAVGEAAVAVAVAVWVGVGVGVGVVVGVEVGGVAVAVPLGAGVVEVVVLGFGAGVVADDRGSRYWLSPADGPESATAAPGAPAIAAASTATAAVRTWRERTARVCQQWISHRQSGFLQDLLQRRTGRQSLDDLVKVGTDQPTETFTTPAQKAPRARSRRSAVSISAQHPRLSLRLHPPSFLRPLIARSAGRRSALAVTAVVAAGLVSGVPNSVGDLQNQISAGQSAASSLRSQIAAETAQIDHTAGGLQAARAQLASVQSELESRIAQLRSVQTNLLAARTQLVDLENRLRVASGALAANLRAEYEGTKPNLMTVILQAHGFAQLLEQVNFLERIGHQDATIVGDTRAARNAVFGEAVRLGALEERDRTLTDDVLAQRNQVAAIEAALLTREISEAGQRSGNQARLQSLNSRLSTLEARAAAQARETAAAVNRSVGGIAIDTSGMVQPPPGAPMAVREIIAAGNAIATLPYIWGGGHASFQAAGYDCSGSVSYVLAAAGLLSSPEVAADFESYGDPGPGQWVTIYAAYNHVWMDVAGWRFDTVALAEDGTRWSRGGGEFAGFVARHPPGL